MNKMIALVAAIALPLAICAQDSAKVAKKAKPATSAVKKPKKVVYVDDGWGSERDIPFGEVQSERDIPFGEVKAKEDRPFGTPKRRSESSSTVIKHPSTADSVAKTKRNQ